MTDFHGDEAKKPPKWPTQNANSQKHFEQNSEIGSWVSWIDGCERNRCGSTYMVDVNKDFSASSRTSWKVCSCEVVLHIRSKIGKIAFLVFLGCFCAFVQQPHYNV